MKNYCLIDTEINYIMGITKPIDPVPVSYTHLTLPTIA